MAVATQNASLLLATHSHTTHYSPTPATVPPGVAQLLYRSVLILLYFQRTPSYNSG